MIVRPTIRADVEKLAALHADSLPTSLFTALGPAALNRYYSFVEASPNEIAWTAADAGEVVGACVVSSDPAGITSRFVRHAPLVFARELASLVVRDRALRRHLVQRLTEAAGEAHTPEVTQIFAHPAFRGRGIGAALLAACERTLRAQRVTSYFVHTERDDNNAGIRFYRREGFVPIGESQSFGRAFLVMRKDLQ